MAIARRVRTPLPLIPCLTLACAALLLAACEDKQSPAPPAEVEARPAAVRFEPIAFADLPGWAEDDPRPALAAFRRSCAGLAKAPDERAVGPDGLAGTVADWRAPCAEIEVLGGAGGGAGGGDQALRALLERGFVALSVVGDEGPEGTITGYYEPELNGAASPSETHRWPLYRLPGDLVRVDLGRFRADLDGQQILGRVDGDSRLVPYFTRAEIDGGALDGRGLELLWLDDPTDVFFLQVQGSGRIRLADGSLRRVGFAGSNGLDYTSIGKAMLAEGLIDGSQASAQGIQAWLRDNPEQAPAVMQRNARFIFFREIDGEGPIGAQGVALTAGRSLAVDSAHLPLGAPVWLDTSWPGSDRPLRRLVVAQDKGAAIKGAVRGDLFWGSGAEALEQAGRMHQRGRFYLLLPSAVAERLRAPAS